MKKAKHYIGFDIANATFVACISKKLEVQTNQEFSNDPEGFYRLLEVFHKHKVSPQSTILRMESTGVYGEHLCYFLYARGYHLCVEAPLKVQRAFSKEDKTDFIDGQQIAEYAYRYEDKLQFWTPNDPRVEKIRVLLSTREHLVNDVNAHASMLHAFSKKVVQNQTTEELLRTNIQQFKKQIKMIEKEIDQIFRQDPSLNQRISNLKKIPGVGLLLLANLFVFTKGLPTQMLYSKIAANLGIVPRKHESGSSVYHKPTSRQQGHRRIRKLLHLAAMSMKTHVPIYQKYYAQKEAQGKEPSVILNNISNKLLRVICAVNRSESGYIKNYQPIHPDFAANK